MTIFYVSFTNCSSNCTWNLVGAHQMFVEGMNEDEETEAQNIEAT